eukprot:scaffold82785_cov30-Tisochrysis_lutea.AAC.8
MTHRQRHRRPVDTGDLRTANGENHKGVGVASETRTRSTPAATLGVASSGWSHSSRGRTYGQASRVDALDRAARSFILEPACNCISTTVCVKCNSTLGLTSFDPESGNVWCVPFCWAMSCARRGRHAAPLGELRPGVEPNSAVQGASR